MNWPMLAAQLWQAARRLPLWVFVCAAVALTLGGGCWERSRAVRRAYNAGRASVLTVTHQPPSAPLVAAQTAATAHTDTIIRRITVTKLRVDTLVEKIADSVQSLPDVSTFIANTYTLTAQVDSLTRAIDVERVTVRLRIAVDSAALVSARTYGVVMADSVRVLKRRPGWKGVGIGVLAGALVALVGAR